MSVFSTGRRASSAAGLAGLALVAVYFLLPAGGLAQAILYGAVGLGTAAALGLGAWWNLAGPARLPWLLLGVGIACFAGGDALFSYYEQTGETPFPSTADVVYLVAYPILFGGVVLLARVRGQELRFALADAFVVAGALALVQWVFVMEPLTRDDSGLARVILLAYPAMDVLLAAGLMRLLFTPAWRAAALWFLAAGVLLLLVADELYLFFEDSYASGSGIDALWLLSYVLFAVAGLHPSVRQLVRAPTAADPRLGWARVILLGAAVLAVPVALLSADPSGIELAILAGLAVALSVVVLLRIVDLVRALSAENEHLRELDRLKGELIGLVSHDLRTPLTSITGYVELLRDDEQGGQEEDRRRFLDVVDRNARRLQRLVDDLLFEARLQAGGETIEPVQVDLAEVARSCVEESRPAAEEAGVTLALDAPSEAVLTADGIRLAQLLDNLVSNAIKFTPAGGRIGVSVRNGGASAVVEVADTGIGIPAGEAARLFGRFARGSNVTERRLPGTGLGLHIAQAIVTAHGGEISVDSAEGAGTTFRVELPLSPPAAGSGSRTP